MVALCFAELAARYPMSGAIYQWARRLGGAVVGWFAGWTMVIAQIITVATAAIALQVVLPAVWSGFQLVGTDSALSSKDGAANAVVLGCLLLVATTLLNATSVRITAVVNSVGVTCELIGVVLIVVLLTTRAERGPSVVLHTTNLDSTTGYVVPLLISALMAAYVLVGFDSAGELSEETHKPRATTPRTIIRAVVASGIGGAFLHRRRADGRAVADRRRSRHAGSALRADQPARYDARQAAAPRRRARRLRVHAGDPDRGRADDLLDGARQRPAGVASVAPGVPPYRHAGRGDHRARRPRRRAAWW